MTNSVSEVMHSSQYDRTSDDSLKDEDNVSWVMDLPEESRDRWLTSLQWIRATDRMVEAESTRPTRSTAYGHHEFMADWRLLRAGRLPEASPLKPLFASLRRQWSEDALPESVLQRWDAYLDALWRYQNPQTVVRTFADYRRSLRDLGGFFEAFPYQPAGLEAAVRALGTLDQFYNNLRDLAEDTRRGICTFPKALLNEFSLESAELREVVERHDPRVTGLFEHLLATLVAELRQEMAPLLRAGPTLHPSWVAMLAHFLTRYSRIEYVARLVGYKASEFSATYWALVQNDLDRRKERSRA